MLVIWIPIFNLYVLHYNTMSSTRKDPLVEILLARILRISITTLTVGLTAVCRVVQGTRRSSPRLKDTTYCILLAQHCVSRMHSRLVPAGTAGCILVAQQIVSYSYSRPCPTGTSDRVLQALQAVSCRHSRLYPAGTSCCIL